MQGSGTPTSSLADSGTLGEAPTGDVNQGDVYQGDVYEGEGLEGDVYQGDVYEEEEGTSPIPPASKPANPLNEDDAKGVPLRGLIVGIFAGTLAAVAWYSLTVATGWQLSLVSWLIGIGVAIATVAGTGRGGVDVALISASVTALALLMGEFQIAKYYEAQENVIYEQAESIEMDGDYTDEEVAMLSGMSYDDFSGLAKREQELLRVLVQVGDEDYEGYEDYEYDEEGGDESVEEEDYSDWRDETLTLGFFLGHLNWYLGWKGILIWLVGVGTAFRIPMGSSDD